METNKTPRTSRRKFLAVCAAGAAVAGASGIYVRSRTKPEMPESVGRLEPGPGAPCPDAPLKPKDIEALGIRRLSDFDRLPWFAKNDAGELLLKPDAGIGPIIDTHAHFGWSFGLSLPIDMTRKCPVQYCYDWDRDQDILFAQDHPNRDEGAVIKRNSLKVFLWTPAPNKTHTAANLSAEMDRMNYRNIVLLPLEIPHQSRHAEETFKAAESDSRFVPLGAIHPKSWGPEKIAALEGQLKRGIKGVKFHPEMQNIAPDDPDMMKLCEWCQANKLLVYAHVGYTGHEPGFMRKKSEPKRFERPLEAFPELRFVFAHTGVRCIDETLEVARKYDDRVWLDVSGRSAANITYIFQRYDTEKIMYASDWPFMALPVMVARGLVATKPCPQLREGFFSGNAKKLFELA